MIKILDCTLRDGGYYTNWDFDTKLIQNYFNFMEYMPIECIEIGYRNKLKNQYFGEYYYLPVSTLKSIKRITSKKLAIMLNAKDCLDLDLDKLLYDLKPYISLVRIATDPDQIEFSLNLSKKIQSLDFEVAINIMYISKIDSNHKIFNFLKDIEKTVTVLNLVDSYGSIYPHELEKLIKMIQNRTNIALGFHGHNNLELAFANTLKSIECGIQYVDSTVLGMGRGSGNLKTELILTYLKSRLHIEIDLNYLGKLTELFMPLKNRYKWGTNLAYMVSGSYSLPQKNVMEALDINRYSLSGIVSQLYNDDTVELPIFCKEENFSSCIIIGGGETVSTHTNIIKEFLNKNQKCLIIHSTSKYIDLFENTQYSQYFAIAGDELLKINDTVTLTKYIFEPDVKKVTKKIKNKNNFYQLKKIDFIGNYNDSPLTISLQIALDMKIENIYLVGYDGYSELKTKKDLYLMKENQEIINSFVNRRKLISLTYSLYDNLEKKSIYGMVL